MFCWQARRRFADYLDGARRDDVGRHLRGCAACRARLAGLEQVSHLVAEAGRAPGVFRGDGAALAFEQRVLREARARALAMRKNASILPAPAPSIASLLRPVPLGAAFSLMILAVALTHFVARAPVDAAGSGAVTRQADSSDLDDGVVPAPEVPFEVQEDLVGTRRGRIPLTSYVLEPAPDVRPVMRASL